MKGGLGRTAAPPLPWLRRLQFAYTELKSAFFYDALSLLRSFISEEALYLGKEGEESRD